MATTKAAPQKKSKGSQGVKHAFIIIILAFIVGRGFYSFILDDPANFADGGRGGHPLSTSGTVYKSGRAIPITFGLLCTVIAMSVERWIVISACSGKGSVIKFTESIEAALRDGDIAKAEELCHRQGGPIVSMILVDLKPYREMEAANTKLKEKVATIQNSHDKATALEMPTTTMSLPIIATIVTSGILITLFEAVFGMIHSFVALAVDGGADSMVLSTGTPEALVSIASGIVTSWFSVVSCNYFINKTDKLAFAMDGIGCTIVHIFEEEHPEARLQLILSELFNHG